MATLQGGSYGDGNGNGHNGHNGHDGHNGHNGHDGHNGHNGHNGHDHIGGHDNDHDGDHHPGSLFGHDHHGGHHEHRDHHDTVNDIHHGGGHDGHHGGGHDGGGSSGSASSGSSLPAGELEGHLVHDSLVFTGGGGQTVIIDFQHGQDLLHIALNINGLPIQSVADVAARVTDINGHAVVDLGHGDSVTLHGVSATDVHHDPGSFFAVVHH